MKKFYVLFIGILFCSFLNAQQVARDKVIVEIATGCWCPYCPGAAMGADDLVANGHDVAIIEYHNGDPYANIASNYRNGSYYNVSGYPTAKFDGTLTVVGGSNTQSMYPQYLPRYNQRIDVNSSFTIDVQGVTYGLIDFEANITVEKVSTSSASNIKLHLVLTESNIEYNWQGMSELNFVERLMTPNHLGTSIDFSGGNTQQVILNFNLEDDWVYENCEVVVFMQNNTTKEILQGTKLSLMDFVPAYDYDAAIIDISNVPEDNCSGTIAPIVTLRNNADSDLVQIDFNYYANEGTVETYSWTGNIAFLETEEVELPAVNFTLAENNTVVVYTTNPNGNPDQYPANDTITQSFGEEMLTSSPVKLMLRLDNHPEETTWEVRDFDDQIIYSGGPYSQAGQNINETFDIATPGCYTFSLYDSGGNGLGIPGFYMLYYGSSSVIMQGTTFGYQVSTQFQVEWVGIEETVTEESMEIYPNPFNNFTKISFNLADSKKVSLDVFNIIGEIVYSVNERYYEPGNHTIQLEGGNLSNGIYFIKLSFGDRILTEKVTVNK
ncbi:MAG: Omp28-related outer membrane protein [Bacteroidales bacterium]|nr:Omp28-related outer membrane protein [Bacteroidales bacterium]